uniref:Uncharacterized protein n=1 Tax=Plectus sambesii TaxID=2011161 RepID=A0A914VE54_9BILA
MGSKKTDADANVETNANLEVNAREATTPSDEQIRFRDSSRDGRRPSSRTKLHKEGRDADTASFSSTMTLNGGERQWLKACAKCDMPVIKRLLQDQPELALFDTDINQRYSPLHFAAKRGHAELIHMLVGAFKFDVNKRTSVSGGYTPLHLAAQHGQSKIVDLLINSFQANTEARDYSGRTYRHYERNRLGTRLVTTVELHAMSATDRLGSRLCKTDRLAFGPRNTHRMYAPRDETIEFQRRWSTPLATTSKKSSGRPQPNRDRDPLRHRGSVSSMAERAVGSLTPTGPAGLSPSTPRRLVNQFIRRNDSIRSVRSNRSEHEGTLV